MKTDKTVIIIAAVGPNKELGANGQLIYPYKSDMQHFKDTTTGHSVIMGRKTFESLPNGPLPNRHNIVITRDPDYNVANVITAHSIQEAIELAPTKRVFIIGGGEIYKLALPFADTMILSEMSESKPEADTFFPEFNKHSIQFPYVTSKFIKDDKTGIIYKISTYMKSVVG